MGCSGSKAQAAQCAVTTQSTPAKAVEEPTILAGQAAAEEQKPAVAAEGAVATAPESLQPQPQEQEVAPVTEAKDATLLEQSPEANVEESADGLAGAEDPPAAEEQKASARAEQDGEVAAAEDLGVVAEAQDVAVSAAQEALSAPETVEAVIEDEAKAVYCTC